MEDCKLSDCRENFSKWKNRFANKKVNAFCDEENWRYWFQFVNNLSGCNEYIKLYIPIDYEHLLDGATMLFSFMDKENISHQSKIASIMRIDNVIVRIRKDDYEALDKILNYINNNEYIRNGLNKCNPFVPTINGIGVMQEHGNSYNDDLSSIISSFIMEARRNNKSDVNIQEFREYLKVNSSDIDLINTFEIAYSGEDKNIQNNNLLTIEQKNSLLIDALKATYKKYGFNQTYKALYEIIKNNNYAYITNGNTNLKLRENLKKKVNDFEIKDFVFGAMKSIDPNYKFTNLDRVIMDYCNYLVQDISLFHLEEISNVTLENYGEEQLSCALYNYINNNSTNNFSRFSKKDKTINYRDKLKYIDRFTVLNLIQRSLNIRGIDTTKLQVNEMISLYANVLSKSVYTSFDERPQMIK